MAGKHWSLDNDEEDGYEVNHDSNENKANNQNDEIDPLDAFMENVTQEVQQLLYEDSMKPKQNKKLKDRDEDEEFVPEKSKYEIEEELFNMRRLQKKDVIAVDHNQIEYEPFRKNFYIETAEIAAMDDDDVSILREQMDGIKVKGVKCPKPIKKWSQCGLNLKILNVIKKLEYEKPTPIQAQAIPAIMSGRDVIGVAKTGSGKTISFLLPMFRHILDQRSLRPTEGPIAMILTPTRELAAQIYTECRRFGKVLGIRSVCAYGGAPIKENISEMKRGTEIIVCTPGRMIDLLTANNGKVTNLRRVTYVVLDEADRMFDLGFEPQVMKIVTNVRPDSQNVMFSATFPRQMEALARSILKNPVEIVVGGRSIVCNDVTQYIEVVDEDQRFNRLLMILGEWQDATGRVLIFVDTQDRADTLLRDLMKKGYPCMSLHAGKDQLDRVSIITDFKSGI
ncbi:DEAD-domain-containing protein, partial [Rozella allomycis CSF55]